MTHLKKKGFTLIELLVVISIISLLSSVIITTVSTARERAKIAAGQKFDDNTYHTFGAEAVVTYNFNENTGTIVYNGGTTNNSASFVGSPTWVTGIHDSALQFANNKIQVNDPTGINTTNGSLSFWVYPTNSTFGQQNPIVNLGGSGFPFYVSLSNEANDKLIGVYNNAWKLGGTQGKSAFVNKWTHVLLSWNNSTLQLYINGKLDAQITNFSPGFPVSVLTIGGDNTGRYAAAKVDNFRVYTQSFQTAEVEKLYAQERATFTVALH